MGFGKNLTIGGSRGLHQCCKSSHELYDVYNVCIIQPILNMRRSIPTRIPASNIHIQRIVSNPHPTRIQHIVSNISYPSTRYEVQYEEHGATRYEVDVSKLLYFQTCLSASPPIIDIAPAAQPFNPIKPIKPIHPTADPPIPELPISLSRTISNKQQAIINKYFLD